VTTTWLLPPSAASSMQEGTRRAAGGGGYRQWLRGNLRRPRPRRWAAVIRAVEVRPHRHLECHRPRRQVKLRGNVAPRVARQQPAWSYTDGEVGVPGAPLPPSPPSHQSSAGGASPFPVGVKVPAIRSR